MVPCSHSITTFKPEPAALGGGSQLRLLATTALAKDIDAIIDRAEAWVMAVSIRHLTFRPARA
jgi:hypothetical protein